MNKFKELLNSYFFLFVIVFLILIGWMSYSIYSTYQTGEFNQTVTTQSASANVAVKQSQTAANTASNFDIERKTEDGIREKTITPKLENLRLRSEQSKIALEKAQNKYRNEKTHPENLAASDADNCRQLQQLFPDTRFADCS